MIGMDAGERGRRGSLSRERVAERYTWDHVTDEVEALYRQLVSSRDKGR
jgi:glycosyltransferase involved in cell wall biosynthesis